MNLACHRHPGQELAPTRQLFRRAYGRAVLVCSLCHQAAIDKIRLEVARHCRRGYGPAARPKLETIASMYEPAWPRFTGRER